MTDWTPGPWFLRMKRWPEDLYGKDPEQIECWICKDTGLHEDGTDCDHEEGEQ